MKDIPTMTNLEAVTFSPAASIRDAMKALDAAGTGALALCDGQGKLVGMLSDETSAGRCFVGTRWRMPASPSPALIQSWPAVPLPQPTLCS